MIYGCYPFLGIVSVWFEKSSQFITVNLRDTVYQSSFTIFIEHCSNSRKNRHMLLLCVSTKMFYSIPETLDKHPMFLKPKIHPIYECPLEYSSSES